jgi:hypothetical protein
VADSKQIVASTAKVDNDMGMLEYHGFASPIFWRFTRWRRSTIHSQPSRFARTYSTVHKQPDNATA